MSDGGASLDGAIADSRHESPDLTTVDLLAPDLVEEMDFAAPDLSLSPDFASNEDLAQTPARCPANAGYQGIPGPGMLPPCGEQGTCNGRTYALDCDGVTCVCSIDKVKIRSFIQLQGTCANLNDAWMSACMF